MNATTLALSSALLCGLPFVSSPSPHVASSPIATQGNSDEATVLIRYDPEAVFLTHELVAPLCKREVVIGEDGAEGPLGELVMQSMESNVLQPRGVFVGLVRIDWASGHDLSEGRREALLESGLDQLRDALASRLVRPRHEQLALRVAVLEDMQSQLGQQLEQKAQMLARMSERSTTQVQLEEVETVRRAGELERRGAQQELLIATTKVQELEANLETARIAVTRVEADLERVRALVDQGLTSQLDLAVAEQQLQTAVFQVDAAQAQIESQRMEVEFRHTQMDAAEDMIAQLDAHIANLESRLATLPEANSSDGDAQLRVGQLTDQGQMTEISAELQRARAELATIPAVTVERW